MPAVLNEFLGKYKETLIQTAWACRVTLLHSFSIRSSEIRFSMMFSVPTVVRHFNVPKNHLLEHKSLSLRYWYATSACAGMLLEFDDCLKDYSISGGSLGYIYVRLEVRI